VSNLDQSGRQLSGRLDHPVPDVSAPAPPSGRSTVDLRTDFQIGPRAVGRQKELGKMARRWFKFETLDDEEFGLGTEEEACEYAAILNDHCGGKLCKPQSIQPHAGIFPI
jgi:hypothetical protein